MLYRVLVCVLATLLVSACSSDSKNAGVGNTAGAGGIGAGSDTVTINGENYPRNPTPGTQADLAVNVGDRVFFGYDSSTVSTQGQDTLERQAAWLQAHPQVTITIEGHADERGTREYNLALGDRRASAVRNYLITLGVAANRVSTISYGKERPAVLGSDESAWSQNRRGVTVVNQ